MPKARNDVASKGSVTRWLSVISMTMIAEGVETTAAACDLARQCHVDMPITGQMDAILRGRTSPRDAIRELMERALKTE